MKKYIKAAYDPSKPEWLDFSSDAATPIRKKLEEDFAMSQAKFYDEPQPNSITIYLVYETWETHPYDRTDKRRYGDLVYIPEYGSYYTDYWVESGDRYRHLDTTSKKNFNYHVVDTTYMVAPRREDITVDRDYVDPRYQRLGNGTLRYNGQALHKERNYNYQTHNYEDQTVWRTQDGYYTKYDKSGYELQSPEQLYEQLLKKYPNRFQNVIDQSKKTLETYYNKIRKARYKIFKSYDIKAGKSPNDEYSYSSVFNDLNYAVSTYGDMYAAVDEALNGPNGIDQAALANLVSGSIYDSIPKATHRIDGYLENIYSKLGIPNPNN